MTISRREFCAAVGAMGLATAMPGAVLAETASTPLRVISYNVLAFTGWPKDSPLAKAAVKQKQMARRIALELALYRPDIINFSESPSEALTQEVAELLGMHHVRFPSGGNWPGTLLSRFEVVESANAPVEGERPAELFTRHWGRAVLKLPSGEPLIVHSAHLFPHADNTARRLLEIDVMLKNMQPDLAAGRSMLLIGDLNHRPDTEEYRRWLEAGWVDTFAKVGKGDGYTINAKTPTGRIDYVMAAGPLAKQITESRPLFEGAFRLNLEDPKAFALSDHLPQLAVFGKK